MSDSPKPWGKIFIILLLAAGVMGIFVWKYQTTLADADGELVHLPPVLTPFYNIFGEAMWLVFGAVAALLFAGASIKVITGKSDFDQS